MILSHKHVSEFQLLFETSGKSELEEEPVAE